MEKRLISSRASPAPASAYSPGLVVGDLVFLAGQGGADPATAGLPDGIEAQTEQVFRNIEALLAEEGLTLADVVSCLVHLSDLALFPAYNAVWEGVFTAEPRPVRTTVGAALLGGMLIEVTAIAQRRGR
jgi:2-iminobutanoate/2-iminopropanoate deaminase